MKRVLITGATGNVGRPLFMSLKKSGVPVRAALMSEDDAQSLKLNPDESVVFDFLESATFNRTFESVDRMFLLRPPALAKPDRDILPALRVAKSSGVKHVTFLSLLGAEKNRIVPHRKIEDMILSEGFSYTFLRPSFFMQNLTGPHALEVKELNEVFVPAGDGRTSFIDARDIAEVATLTLLKPEDFHNKAIPLTGSEALTYSEIAAILTTELGRPIQYNDPSLFKFAKRMRKRGFDWSYIAVMMAIYTVNRFGLAGVVTDDLRNILGRDPITFAQFARDYRQSWL